MGLISTAMLLIELFLFKSAAKLHKKSDIYKEKRFFLKKNAKKFAHVKKKQYFCTRF